MKIKVFIGIVAAVFMASMASMASAGQAPNEVNLTATVGEGNMVTLAWNNQWAQTCTASGGWSGTKQTSGSETVGPVVGTESFKLTCLGPFDNQARLSWQAPTKFTDGTDLPANYIAKYRVYRGTNASSLTLHREVTSLESIDTGLAVGPIYYAVTAVGQDGLESDKSAVGSKTIVAPFAAEDEETLRVANPPMLGEVQ